jgi:hypothetical protein
MTERTHWEECWREHHECAVKMIEDFEQWKLDLVYKAAEMTLDLTRKYVQSALDPDNSSAARELIRRGRQESRKRIAKLEAKLAAYERAHAAMSQAMKNGMEVIGHDNPKGRARPVSL